MQKLKAVAEIREYKEHDYFEVSEILKHELSRIHMDKDQRKQFFDFWNHDEFQKDKHHFYVFQHKKKIVAFALLEKNTVRLLFVHDDHKKNSLGLKMLNFLEKKASKKHSYIFIHAFPDYAEYFERYGYKLGDAHHDPSSGIIFLEMHKRLHH